MERAGRKGKGVTLVKGFISSEPPPSILYQLLKQKIGVRYSTKNGEVAIQSNHRQILIKTKLLTNRTTNVKSVSLKAINKKN